MTSEQIAIAYGAIQTQIAKLKEQQGELLVKAVANAKYPIGTKIKKKHGKSTECAIVHVFANYWGLGSKRIEIQYKYAPVLKDGSIGAPVASRYGISEAEMANLIID